MLLQNEKVWHQRYLNLAKEVSQWSKDPNTQVGAIAVGLSGQVLSQGYNGFPRKVEDLEHRWDDKELKYKFVIHAEMNCIYNATLNGVSLSGAKLYIWGTRGIPVCHECAKGIIQVGVKEVIMPKIKSPRKEWLVSHEYTKLMFRESDVKLLEFDI